jgi:hypothetical protein
VDHPSEVECNDQAKRPQSNVPISVIIFLLQGKISGTTKSIEGTVIIPNLSDENNAEEVDVNVSTTATGPDADAMKQMMRIVGAKVIREQLAKYIKSLKEG